MVLSSRVLACGSGWRVSDVVCSAGPSHRPFEEQHDGFCIAAVMQGTFQYCSTRGAAVLGPGAVLLGNSGQCFECGHEHGRGDRCLVSTDAAYRKAEIEKWWPLIKAANIRAE